MQDRDLVRIDVDPDDARRSIAHLDGRAALLVTTELRPHAVELVDQLRVLPIEHARAVVGFITAAVR